MSSGEGACYFGRMCDLRSHVHQNIQCRFLAHFNFCGTNCPEEYFDPKRKSSRKMEYALRNNGIHNIQFSTNTVTAINSRKVKLTEQV
jgi:hypothetical protein